jgi:alkanesulfonate monooxygenase SsuD/methylene tetrahydromethanopterin reductase-like flavin-dependent oxidoreductase (luciferase family)
MGLATALEPTVELWNVYRDRAAQAGYQIGPENFGFLQNVYVAETEEKAYEISKQSVFGGAGSGYSLFSLPQFFFPSGYVSKNAVRRLAEQFANPSNAAGGSPFQTVTGKTPEAGISSAQVDHRSKVWQQNAAVDIEKTRKLILDSHTEGVKNLNIICGTPDTVIRKLRVVLETLRPGIFLLWQNDGPITRKDRESNLKLLGREVMPALRQFGRELNLTSPFEVTPGSRPLPSHGKPESVGSIEPWKAWQAANP